MLGRFVRRYASWEADTPVEELRRTEFRESGGATDYSPSVYLLPEDDVAPVRAYAEHVATPPLDLKDSVGIDAANFGAPLVVTPGSEVFAYIRDLHREYRLSDDEHLDRFVYFLRERVRAGVCRPIRKRDVEAYVRGRLEAKDEEWSRAVLQGEKDWLRRMRHLCV